MQDKKRDEKILKSADNLFTQKGYAATSMRDIAEEAGVNPALIYYYYNNKEYLFKIIMRNKVKQLFGSIIPYIQDETTTIENKLDKVMSILYEVISKDHNLPMFVFSEIQKQDTEFASIIPAKEIKTSSMYKQISEKCPHINPMHFIINLLSMVFYPYILSPMMQKTKLVSEEEMSDILNERVKLIPRWMKQILNININNNIK